MQTLDLAEYARLNGWRISPLACALTFSAREGEDPQFESAAHLKLISDAIVDAVNGTGPKKLIISMPPRAGKSTLVTRRTPEWFLGSFPHLTVGMCGYGGGFAKDWGRLVRNDLGKHQDLVGFTIAEDSQAADRWHTSRGGGMWTAGIRGQITGKGANLLIIDDPIKDEQEAYSLTERNALWNWWMSTASTRTYPDSVIIVVATRWHSDDLLGRILSSAYPGDPASWRNIVLPAIWENDVPDEIGRKKGQALWEAKFPADWLISERKANMSLESWTGLYQQQPMNLLGLGAVYYDFDKVGNVREVERDDRLPLCWSLDFNVNPMSSVIAQVREAFSPMAFLTNEKIITVEVLDEIALPNSNTPEVCEEFYDRYQTISRGRKTEVWLYGDATAGRRDTRGSETDWSLVTQFLANKGIPYRNYVDKTNPSIRNRTNTVNGALKTAEGPRRVFIHPRCKELLIDLEEVRWKKDASGNSTSQLDNSDPARTHISDALGYLIWPRFSRISDGGEMAGHAR